MMNKKTKANYGFDAPGWAIGMGAAGLVGMVGVFALLMLFPAQIWALAVSAVSMLLSLALIGLSSCMVIYYVVGKARTRDYMLSRVNWTGTERVLDVGVGSGLLLIGAAKRLTSGQAIGIDAWRSQDLSKMGKESVLRNAELEGASYPLEVRTEDARSIQEAAGSVDVVMSLLCLHNIEPEADQAVACREIARVLKPGGRVVIGDYVPTTPYAKAFSEAGLVVTSSAPRFDVALSLMWILEATKPK